MDLIIKRGSDIVTGDLNLDDREYEASSWKNPFTKGDVTFQPPEYTWGGDQFCAQLVGDTAVSQPLNLDYTLGLNHRVVSLFTSLIKTGFNSTFFSPTPLSDHEGLFSQIKLRFPLYKSCE